MRCQSIRSVFRAALVAGLIASFQGPTLSASWKNSLNPLTSTCYIHDLQWEQINSIRGEYRTEPIVTSNSDIEISVDRETELCVAPAHQYEFEMQVAAALDALRSKSIQFAQAGTKLFQRYSPSPTLLISSIACQSLKLLDWGKITDSLPMTVVASDVNQDFDCDWNCGDWCNNAHYSSSISLPKRSTANIFVYSINASTEPNDSDSNSDETDLTSESSIGSDQFSLAQGSVADSDQAEFIADIVSAEIESVPVASTQVGLDKQINQVGIDPVCPEQWSNHEITWNDCFVQPSVCCPLDTDVEAIGVEPKTLQSTTPVRPPTLEAELDIHDSSHISKIDAQGIGHCAPTLENHCQAEVLHSATAELSEMNYCSQDFLTTLHTSNYGSIILPVLDTHRLAVDYAFTDDSAQATESGSQMTKGIASQIRTVGQFLVDFANQIESQLEQVEIARRDSLSR